MGTYINLTGTWIGYYSYNKEYGAELSGQQVKFMLFLTQKNFKFEGTSVDYEGVGADFSKALIRGFVKEDFISFIKQYPQSLEFDLNNKLIANESKQPPEIHYTGLFNEKTKIFSGQWEIVAHVEQGIDGDWEYLNTGLWEMKKDE
jgi:hypothetical protein